MHPNVFTYLADKAFSDAEEKLHRRIFIHSFVKLLLHSGVVKLLYQIGLTLLTAKIQSACHLLVEKTGGKNNKKRCQSKM